MLESDCYEPPARWADKRLGCSAVGIGASPLAAWRGRVPLQGHSLDHDQVVAEKRQHDAGHYWIVRDTQLS
jgi:hypothetical protein